MREHDLLRGECAAVGVEVEAHASERLLAFLELIRNAPFRATSIADHGSQRRKLLVDSLSCLPCAAVHDGEVSADIGSGVGLPGIPIAIVCPRARVLLVEPSRKKAAFLRDAVNALGLMNVVVEAARAEDLGHESDWRERLDCVVARAVAPLRILAELSLPLCRLGGRMVALKGPAVGEELREAQNALVVLGGEVLRREAFCLPVSGERRVVLRLGKVRPTPGGFPRRISAIRRRPL